MIGPNPKCRVGTWGCDCREDLSGKGSPYPGYMQRFGETPEQWAERVGYEFPSTEGLDMGSGPITSGKLPPMNCKRCNYRNEYVGAEHLDEAGRYTCRPCKQNPYR